MKLVLKLSGKVLEDPDLRRSLGCQTAHLNQAGHRLLLVHGGGMQLTSFSEELGIPVIQVQGRRVTDARTLEAAKKVFGAVNTDLTASLLAEGVPAVGIAAFDGFLTRSKRRPPLDLKIGGQLETLDFGFVGSVDALDTKLIETLWSSGFVPVVRSLCCSQEGQVLNINADTLATEITLALKADRLVAVSDVDGIYLDPGRPETRLPRLELAEARRMLREGVFLDGMIPKVENAIRLLEAGIESFQLLSGMHPNALAQCIDGGSGTTISRGSRIE